MRSVALAFAVLIYSTAARAQIAPNPVELPVPPRVVQCPSPPCAPVFTYTAKFVCGATEPGANVVAAGRYFSTVNVHNPQRAETVRFFKKFAVARPLQRPGHVTDYFRTQLAADEAFLIDCGDIANHLQVPPASFAEGFVVLESPRELDVVTVYTASAGPAGGVVSIHTERVPMRLAEPCLGQTRTLATGTAPWTVVAEPSGPVTPRPANIVTTHPWVQPTPMVSWNATAASGTSNGVYEYEFCFCLCTPDMSLNITRFIADNVGTVLLNGTVLGSSVNSTTGANWATAAELQSINRAAAAVVRPGKNCLRVRVEDTSASNTGFILEGLITGTLIPCAR